MRRYNYANSAYVDNGDLRDAIAELVTALDLYPDDPETFPNEPAVEAMQTAGELPRA